MKIKNIEITNIKGISNHNFELELIPNKPNILVAPNGFGKSSFAIAFDSLRRSKIELDSKCYHLNNEENRPTISINIEDTAGRRTLLANDTQNSISDEFDIFVINSQLLAKATKLKIGGKLIAKPSMEIAPTELISTIPKKIDFTYKPDKAKKSFGKNGKILPNITKLLSCASIMYEIGEKIDFQKFSQVKNKKILNDIKSEINTFDGSSETIKTWIESNKKDELTSISEFAKISCVIRYFIEITTDVDSYLAAFQIIELSQNMRSNFKKAVNYICYLEDKVYYENTIANFTLHAIQLNQRKIRKRRN